MFSHKTGTKEEWLSARMELLKAEKALTRQGDELAKQLRELPWVPVEENYQFETEKGKVALADLFEGRSQLIIYHFMFGLDYTAGCPICSASADSFNGVLPHIEARDVTMICVSRAPLDKLLAYRKRMGWNFNWASSYHSQFNFDFNVSAMKNPHGDAPLLGSGEIAALPFLGDKEFREKLPALTFQNAEATGTNLEGYLSEGHGFSVFAREGDSIYHCYSNYNRGTEFLMGFYAILDRTPKGRDETGSGTWMHRHDEYGTTPSKDCCH